MSWANRIRVVSGVAVRRRDGVGEIFMALRPRDAATRPGLWELPGGKVDPGETAPRALRREWREELDVDVAVGDRLATVTLDLVDQIFEVELFEVHPEPGAALSPEAILQKRLYHEDACWVSPRHAVTRMPCSPGYYMHYPGLMSHLVGGPPFGFRRRGADSVRVVRGVCVRRHANVDFAGERDELLLGTRRPGVEGHGFWEMPGGSTPLGADAREFLGQAWSEEIGVPVTVGSRIARSSLDLYDRVLQIDLLEVRPLLPCEPSGIRPSGTYAELRWSTPGFAAKSLPCPPEYYLHYPALVSWLGDRRLS